MPVASHSALESAVVVPRGKGHGREGHSAVLSSNSLSEG
jgi:hypothetical protein